MMAPQTMPPVTHSAAALKNAKGSFFIDSPPNPGPRRGHGAEKTSVLREMQSGAEGPKALNFRHERRPAQRRARQVAFAGGSPRPRGSRPAQGGGAPARASGGG